MHVIKNNIIEKYDQTNNIMTCINILRSKFGIKYKEEEYTEVVILYKRFPTEKKKWKRNWSQVNVVCCPCNQQHAYLHYWKGCKVVLDKQATQIHRRRRRATRLRRGRASNPDPSSSSPASGQCYDAILPNSLLFCPTDIEQCSSLLFLPWFYQKFYLLSSFYRRFKSCKNRIFPP